MLYAGLKFTGLALNVAGDLAKAVRQDAERMMKELEADAAAKVGHNFISLTAVQSGAVEPVVTYQTSWLDSTGVRGVRQCLACYTTMAP